MKFIRFQIEDRVTVGVLSPDGASAIELVSLQEELQGDDLPALLQKLDDKTVADLQKLLQTGAYGPQGIYPLEEVRLLSPVGRPIHDIICVGVNYYDHLEETKKFDSSVTGKKKTVYFSKRTTGLKGPGEKIQFMPALDSALDYEVELAVIIGKKGVNIPREKAEEYIFGYSVFNDVSARSLQTAHVQWYKGKSLDSFCCLGPWIVSKDELPLPLS